jgi:Serine dehydrogenase proteinase
MPDEVLELMSLHPQPVRAQGGGVEYLPGPRQRDPIPRERTAKRMTRNRRRRPWA